MPASGRCWTQANSGELARKAMDTADLMGPQRSDVQMDVTVYWMRQGDFPRALQHWNTVLRHQPSLRGQLFPYLLKSAEEPASQSAFETLLRKPIPWWSEFFIYSASKATGTDTVRRLYSLSRKGPNALPPEALRAYFARLQKDGEWTEAWFAWLGSLGKEALAQSASKSAAAKKTSAFAHIASHVGQLLRQLLECWLETMPAFLTGDSPTDGGVSSTYVFGIDGPDPLTSPISY